MLASPFGSNERARLSWRGPWEKVIVGCSVGPSPLGSMILQPYCQPSVLCVDDKQPTRDVLLISKVTANVGVNGLEKGQI